MWLREVKNMPTVSGPKWQEKELFKEYMEDYNTCTFPSEKYYNVEMWEAKQRDKKRRRLQKKLGIVAPVRTAFDDEKAREYVPQHCCCRARLV